MTPEDQQADQHGGVAIKLKVYGILSDQATESQIVLLRDEQSTEVLPIWVGTAEGQAIRMAMEGVSAPRPMTHDLLKSLMQYLKITPKKVVVNSIKNGTYYAALHLEAGETDTVIDARPSDAIALALRCGTPIYTTEEVIHKKGAESLDLWLEKLNPKDAEQGKA